MKTIHVDVFNLAIAVFRSDKARVKHLIKNGFNATAHDNRAIASAHVDTTSNRFCLSFVIKKDASKSVWVHECSHMADFICDILGVPISLKNTEIRAYLIQHLFSELEKALEADK